MGNLLNKPKSKPEVKSRLSVRIASEKDIVEPTSITKPRSAKSFTFDMTSHALPEYPVTYVNTPNVNANVTATENVTATATENVTATATENATENVIATENATAKVEVTLEPDVESVEETVIPFTNLTISIEDMLHVPQNSPVSPVKVSPVKTIQYVECYEYKNMKNLIL